MQPPSKKTEARSSGRSKRIKQPSFARLGAWASTTNEPRRTVAAQPPSSRPKGEAAPHPDLSGQVALWIGHNNLNAPPAVQNDGCVFGTKRLVEDAVVGLDLTVRRLGSVVNVAVDLIDHLTELAPISDKERSLSVKSPQMRDRLSPKRGHLKLRCGPGLPQVASVHDDGWSRRPKPA